jgi:hypothetical protein
MRSGKQKILYNRICFEMESEFQNQVHLTFRVEEV